MLYIITVSSFSKQLNESDYKNLYFLKTLTFIKKNKKIVWDFLCLDSLEENKLS